MITNKILRVMFITVGSISLSMAVIGIVLPVLPTTPFLLLTLFCYARGSIKFHTWFLSTSLYKNHLNSFVKYRAFTLKTKIAILLPVTVMISIPFILVYNTFMRIFLVLLILAKYLYFFRCIKTIPTVKIIKKEDTL